MTVESTGGTPGLKMTTGEHSRSVRRTTVQLGHRFELENPTAEAITASATISPRPALDYVGAGEAVPVPDAAHSGRPVDHIVASPAGTFAIRAHRASGRGAVQGQC